MFSPSKALIAGAVVFGIGGVMLIAQPLDQQGAFVPGAAAPVPPVEVTGSGTGGPCPNEGTVAEGESVRSTRDGYCNPFWNMSDPRLNGTVTWAANEDEFLLDDNGLNVSVVGVSIVNEEGAWRMLPEVRFETPDVVPGAVPAQFVLVGEGAYEGLYAVLASTDLGSTNGTLQGFIVQGEVPPAPEAAGAP
jgi:hypothetical protein